MSNQETPHTDASTARREFLKYLGGMAAVSGAVTGGAFGGFGWNRAGAAAPDPVDGEGFAERHRAYGSLPRHGQHAAGTVPVPEAGASIETGDGVEPTATVGRVWAGGLPYGLALRGAREQAWRHQFEADEIPPGDWVDVDEVNYGFVTCPPHKVPILRLYAVLDKPRTSRDLSDLEVRLRVVQVASRETVFEVSATDPRHEVRYQEWPLSELEYGTAGTSRTPDQARFVVQARSRNGPGRVRPSSLGLDTEVL